MIRTTLLAAGAALGLMAAPALADDPFEVSNQRCLASEALVCTARLQGFNDTDFVTIADYMQFMHVSFDRLVEMNGWQGMNIDPSMEIPFRKRVAHGQLS